MTDLTGSDDPTPVASDVPGSSSSHVAESPEDQPHPHGAASHTHGEATGSSALDRLVQSVRGMFHRNDKP